MSERRKQTEFLKVLLRYEDTEECRSLEDRLHKTERDEKCLWYACGLVGLVVLFSLAGVGYSAVLHPKFFENDPPALVKGFCAVGLGAVICLSLFTGLWLWYRAASNRLYGEGRHYVLGVMESKAMSTGAPRSTGSVPKQDTAPYQIGTAAGKAEPVLVSFRQAS